MMQPQVAIVPGEQNQLQMNPARINKTMRKRAFSAKIQRGVQVYGSKMEFKKVQKIKKEQSLGQLQQSRKDIMVQRLELHNVRD